MLKLQAELEEMRQHSEYQQAAYDGLEKQKVIEVQALEDRLRSLKEENLTLASQLSQQLSERQTNQHSNSQRPHHPSQPSLATISINDSVKQQDWRSTASTLADLIVKFLHSMRRLQKVVHRKEASVQKEKQEFEMCKKELEVFVKQVKAQVEGNLGPVSESQNQSNLDLPRPMIPGTQSVRVGPPEPWGDDREKLHKAEKAILDLQTEN